MTSTMTLKTILVAIDGSALSQTVMQMLHHLRLETEATVVLARVLANSNASPDVIADRPQTDIEDVPQHHLEILQTYQSQLPCRTEFEVVTGDPAEEIVRLAHIHHADLIVLGNRGLTGVNRILQGSVSSQVMADAHCSVLVVKSEGR